MAATRDASAAATIDAGGPEALFRKLPPGPGRSPREVSSNQRARLHSALIEIVGTQGYDFVTVRELARLAGVSTRTLYEQFPGGLKEAFLLSLDVIVQRAAGRIDAAYRSVEDWRERLSLVLSAFAAEIERRPAAARLALVEALTAGPAALERLNAARSRIRELAEESFATAPDRIAMPPLLLEGVVAGVESVARTHLLAGRERELPRLSAELVEWALCFRDPTVAQLERLDHRTAAPPPVAEVDAEEAEWPVAGDERALILAATAKLVAAGGCQKLTVTNIRDAAGVSRRRLDESFSSIEACAVAVLELHVERALSSAAAASADGRGWPERTHRAIETICGCIASDPVLARLGFTELFSLGSAGIDCRERLVASIAELLRNSAPEHKRPSRLAAEASVGAIWGLIHCRLVAGRTQQLQQIAPVLSLLALAPAIGAPAAMEAIAGASTTQETSPQPMWTETNHGRGSFVRPLRQISTTTIS